MNFYLPDYYKSCMNQFRLHEEFGPKVSYLLNRISNLYLILNLKKKKNVYKQQLKYGHKLLLDKIYANYATLIQI